jgi:hypothetical protein
VVENNGMAKVHGNRKESRTRKMSPICALVALATFLLNRIEDFWRLGV